MALPSISIIGSGNLATHLAKVFFQNNIEILQIGGRNPRQVNELASLVNAKPVLHLPELQPGGIIIICVSDSAIPEVSKAIPAGSLVVHTSGSTSMDVLSHHSNHGVFYPFQTFSKNIPVDFRNVPVFTEACSVRNLAILNRLASVISDHVSELSSENRLRLHLAAVFACNFTNHMYTIAGDILQQANLPFEILNHLIGETTSKAINSGNPAAVQTGPAVRGNRNILLKHNEMLANNPVWQKIYTFVSNSIMDRENNKNGTF